MTGEFSDHGSLRYLPLAQLVAGYEYAVSRLVNAEHRVGQPQPADVVHAAALDALAIAAAITARLRNERWTNATDAIRHGATLDDVAAAMDLSRAEVIAGLQHHLLTYTTPNLLEAGLRAVLDEDASPRD